ncbi:MAG: hypothetical protein J6U45_02870 [Alistipes sp.]|nr:hypothetical protein [Alistipes sp.]
MKIIGGALIAIGGFCLFGTAGASDQNLITFEEMVPQVLLCLASIAGGILFVRIDEQLKRRKR